MSVEKTTHRAKFLWTRRHSGRSEAAPPFRRRSPRFASWNERNERKYWDKRRRGGETKIHPTRSKTDLDQTHELEREIASGRKNDTKHKFICRLLLFVFINVFLVLGGYIDWYILPSNYIKAGRELSLGGREQLQNWAR